MSRRIRSILLICNSYDSFSLEEDGRIETQIAQEYAELGLSNPPQIRRVETTAEALNLFEGGERFDLVVTMYYVGEISVFDFSEKAKGYDPDMPIVLLSSFSREVYRKIEAFGRSSIDYVFCWNNSTDLIIAIIKLLEDQINAEDDMLGCGVQGILLVEDSIRYYSTYLPALYRMVLQQNKESIKDTLNEQQQVARKRARPKILMATNYDDAVALYRKYSEVYRIPEILDGKAPEAALQLKNAPFDEKLSLLGLLTAALGQEFRDWAEELDVQRTVFELMKELRDGVQSGSIGSAEEWLSLQTEQRKKVFETELRARLIGRGQERRKRMVLRRLSGMMEALRSRTREDGRGAYAFLRTMFTSEETARKARAEETGRHLTNTFLFLDRVFGQGQEMVLFLTDLSAGRDSLRFVREQGNEEYYKYNRMLLLKDSREELRNEVMKLL